MTGDGLQRLPAALFEIGKLIGSDLDPGILLAKIAELVCQLIDAKACSIMLLDADRRRLQDDRDTRDFVARHFLSLRTRRRPPSGRPSSSTSPPCRSTRDPRPSPSRTPSSV